MTTEMYLEIGGVGCKACAGQPYRRAALDRFIFLFMAAYCSVPVIFKQEQSKQRVLVRGSFTRGSFLELCPFSVLGKLRFGATAPRLSTKVGATHQSFNHIQILLNMSCS